MGQTRLSGLLTHIISRPGMSFSLSSCASLWDGPFAIITSDFPWPIPLYCAIWRPLLVVGMSLCNTGGAGLCLDTILCCNFGNAFGFANIFTAGDGLVIIDLVLCIGFGLPAGTVIGLFIDIGLTRMCCTCFSTVCICRIPLLPRLPVIWF